MGKTFSRRRGGKTTRDVRTRTPTKPKSQPPGKETRAETARSTRPKSQSPGRNTGASQQVKATEKPKSKSPSPGTRTQAKTLPKAESPPSRKRTRASTREGTTRSPKSKSPSPRKRTHVESRSTAKSRSPSSTKRTRTSQKAKRDKTSEDAVVIDMGNGRKVKYVKTRMVKDEDVAEANEKWFKRSRPDGSRSDTPDLPRTRSAKVKFNSPISDATTPKRRKSSSSEKKSKPILKSKKGNDAAIRAQPTARSPARVQPTARSPARAQTTERFTAHQTSLDERDRRPHQDEQVAASKKQRKRIYPADSLVDGENQKISLATTPTKQKRAHLPPSPPTPERSLPPWIEDPQPYLKPMRLFSAGAFEEQE